MNNENTPLTMYFNHIAASTHLLRGIALDPTIPFDEKNQQLLVMLKKIDKDMDVLYSVLRACKESAPQLAWKADLLEMRLKEIQQQLRKVRLTINYTSL